MIYWIIKASISHPIKTKALMENLPLVKIVIKDLKIVTIPSIISPMIGTENVKGKKKGNAKENVKETEEVIRKIPLKDIKEKIL